MHDYANIQSEMFMAYTRSYLGSRKKSFFYAVPLRGGGGDGGCLTKNICLKFFFPTAIDFEGRGSRP